MSAGIRGIHRVAYPRLNHPLSLAWLPALTLSAAALEIRSYDPAVHNRFTGFPGAPVMNPTFLHDAARFTGTGWFASGAHKQCTLVSPRHFVWATHHIPLNGEFVRFLDSGGTVVQRQVNAVAVISKGLDGDSDLTLATLSAAVPATVKPHRYLNLEEESDYLLTPVMVFGFVASPVVQPRAGRGTIAGFDDADINGNITRVCRFDYSTLAGQPDDAHLIPGDSGSASFADAGGEAALVGVHAFYLPESSPIQNFDTFIPHYIAELDAQMAPLGYRMRPANYTPTTLSFTTATAPVSLRQAHPGSVTFTFANSGAQLTGNAELTLAFTAGQEPSSISAPGWVVESTGASSWSIRKATMAAAEDIAVVASWTSLPAAPALAVNATIQSDTATGAAHAPSFTLNPSYAAWALGLAEAGQEDDPDEDALPNLLEYAFGGDAESGSMLLSSGDSLRPLIAHAAGNVTLSYPERSDAVLRGLSYQVETSADLDSLAGAVSLPPGAVSSTQPYVPDVPGFVKRVITWPSDGPVRFARVKVELSE